MHLVTHAFTELNVLCGLIAACICVCMCGLMFWTCWAVCPEVLLTCTCKGGTIKKGKDERKVSKQGGEDGRCRVQREKKKKKKGKIAWASQEAEEGGEGAGLEPKSKVLSG